MSDNTSTDLISLQRGLFNVLNPNIKIIVEENVLTASNINEKDIIDITLVTNNPNNNSSLLLVDAKIFLNNDFLPSEVAAFNDFLKLQVALENSKAFSSSKRTYKPWVNGFTCGNINVLCDKLSRLTRISPDTEGIPRTYTLVFMIIK